MTKTERFGKVIAAQLIKELKSAVSDAVSDLDVHEPYVFFAHNGRDMYVSLGGPYEKNGGDSILSYYLPLKSIFDNAFDGMTKAQAMKIRNSVARGLKTLDKELKEWEGE